MRRVMIRFRIILAGVMVWVAGAWSSHGFSLLGQFQAWQTSDIGYQQPGDIGGPVRPNQGYRWNLPEITYGFDQTFITYFGPDGMRAVDQAMKVFNDLPPMSKISTDGFSFFVNGEIVPTTTTQVNQDARALGLIDLKSFAMHMVIEELGLAEPERWAWALRGRQVTTATDPDITNYTVINLNFDPITLQPSPVVNGITYGYDIVEANNPFVSDAEEIPVDVLSTFPFTSVAGARSLLTASVGGASIGTLQFDSGRFYTGLTHDDVGGLRWLYSSKNFAVENLETNVTYGTPARGGGSPWAPFFGGSNIVVGTNILFNTNLLVREALRPGINDLRFRRVNFDSQLGRLMVPITNRYMDQFLTNGRVMIQPVQRVITLPDIIFVVDDLGLDTGLVPFLTSRSPTSQWINNDAINGRDTTVDGGPGVIAPPVTITFTDQLPGYFLDTDIFFILGIPFGFGPPLDSTLQTKFFSWGSFDESSSTPIIYPQYGHITIQDLRQSAVGGGN